MSFDENEMWYLEKYMENRPADRCDECIHSFVCWKVGTDNAPECRDFNKVKAKDFLPLLGSFCVIERRISGICSVELDPSDLKDESVWKIYPRLDDDGLAELIVEVEDEDEA